MKDEPTLFDFDEQPHKLVNLRGTTASYEAAARIAPQLKGIKRRIVDLLEARPEGLTIFEIAELLNLKLQTVSGRPSELIKKDLIFVYGTRITPEHKKVTIYKHIKYKKEK